LAAPGIAAALLLAFMYAWNNFIFVLILGGEHAERQVCGQIVAAVLVSILPVLALTLCV
jgi:multiple sugar transport system permease protein